MDRLEAMLVFTRVSERRSFTLAARDLGLPASTVTEAVKQLEARLGVRLLQRTTRHVRPTLDGEAYYARCIAILSEIEDAEGGFRGAKPRGVLRIDVQGGLARRFILPALPRFLADYPDLTIHMSEGDRLVDLVREGIDCVLRVGVPQDSDMIARRVAMLEEVTVCSPSYIAAFGRPERWDRLSGHRMVGFMSSARGQVLPLEFLVDGVAREVTLPSIMTVNAAQSYGEAGRHGLGLIQAPRYGLADFLARGELVEVLRETPPSPSPVSLLYPRSRQLSPRLRVFIDWAAGLFQGQTI